MLTYEVFTKGDIFVMSVFGSGVILSAAALLLQMHYGKCVYNLHLHAYDLRGRLWPVAKMVASGLLWMGAVIGYGALFLAFVFAWGMIEC